MEGLESADISISIARHSGKANDSGLHVHYPGADRLHLGCCEGDAGDQIVDRRSELCTSPMAGGGITAG